MYIYIYVFLLFLVIRSKNPNVILAIFYEIRFLIQLVTLIAIL